MSTWQNPALWAGNRDCQRCNELFREMCALRKANEVLRGQNIKLAVENNNLRHSLGVHMQPVTLDHRTEWEMNNER